MKRVPEGDSLTLVACPCEVLAGSLGVGKDPFEVSVDVGSLADQAPPCQHPPDHAVGRARSAIISGVGFPTSFPERALTGRQGRA